MGNRQGTLFFKDGWVEGGFSSFSILNNSNKVNCAFLRLVLMLNHIKHNQILYGVDVLKFTLMLRFQRKITLMLHFL